MDAPAVSMPSPQLELQLGPQQMQVGTSGLVSLHQCCCTAWQFVAGPSHCVALFSAQAVGLLLHRTIHKVYGDTGPDTAMLHYDNKPPRRHMLFASPTQLTSANEQSCVALDKR